MKNFFKSKYLKIISDLLITIGIMTVVTMVSLMFRSFHITESNIIMLFILGVLLVSTQTDGYTYGICASVLGVLSFNFFFTHPLYTFLAYSNEYPITFGIMLIVAIITSTLTTKFKREAELSHLREKRTETLYKISRNLLTTRNIDQVISTAAVNIANLCNSNVVLYTIDEKNNLTEPYIYTIKDDSNMDLLLSDKESKAAFDASIGGKTIDSKIYYLPINGRNKTLGVIGVDCHNNHLTQEQKHLIDAVSIQIALSIERENYSKKQQKYNIEIKSERMRSNLLRAVSHDLKTPLTGIAGASSAILDSWNNIDDDTKKSLLMGVYNDALWLSHSVDNILNITRMEDGRIEINKNMEAVEEIIAEAVSRVEKYAGNHTIKTKIPDNLMMVLMDGILIEQVLVNLIDNAVKYTPEGSTINVFAKMKDDSAVFEVSDNGNGICAADLPFVFDRFFTSNTIANNSRKGMGLGLAICKSIVLAHNGNISASNGENGGAVFRFTLPVGE